MIERFLPATVRGRLAFTYGALSLLLVLGLGAYLILTVRGRYENRLASQLEEQARMAGSATAPYLVANSADTDIDAMIDTLGTAIPTRLTIIAGDGHVIADSKNDPSTLPPETNRTDTEHAIEASTAGNNDEVVRSKRGGSMVITIPIPGVPSAVARSSTSLDDVTQAVEKFQRNVLATGLVVSWISLVVAIYVAGRITGPLGELRRHAGLVAAGQLDTSVTPASTRELGDLARAFNTMTRRVRELVEESDRSRSRLEAIFANLSDGVVTVDKESSVIGINASAASILGTRPNWALGRPFVVVARDADLNRLLQSAFESGKQHSATITYGRTDQVLDAVAQAVDRQGERLGIIVIRNVTELKRLESVRREFVANVSHELRTPLASIRALVETLEAGAIDDRTVAGDFLARVVGEVSRLTALVDELLDLARLESDHLMLKLEPSEPSAILTTGVERLRPHRGLIDALEAKEGEVASQRDVNAGRLEALPGELAGAKRKLIADSRVRQSTVDSLQLTLDGVPALQASHDARPSDPYAVARAMAELEQDAQHAAHAATLDVELLGRAKKQIQAARIAVDATVVARDKTQNDGIPDSRAIKQTLPEVPKVVAEVERLERELKGAHAEWDTLEHEAMDIIAEATVAKTTLTHEYDAAQTAQQALKAASGSVRTMNGWPSKRGVRIDGTSVRDQLQAAVDAMADDAIDYDTVAQLATAVSQDAASAVVEADREVQAIITQEAIDDANRRAEEAAAATSTYDSTPTDTGGATSDY